MSPKVAIDVKNKVPASAGLNSNWLLPKSSQIDIDELRVLDVGQGDAVAVWGNSKIIMYVDFGGCVYHPDKLNYANAANRLSISHNPVVVLTHWDKDHYHSATKVRGVEKCKWLVPRQRVGPQAAKFAKTLKKAFLWPESIGTSLKTFSAGSQSSVQIQKCGPFPAKTAAEDRNVTGLALKIVRQENNTQKTVILPGDAPFDRVPMLATLTATTSVVGLLAYHHGSHNHWTATTTSIWSKLVSTLPGPKLVFSYGKDKNGRNQYGHPQKQNYSSNGIRWSNICETPNTPTHSKGFGYCTIRLK